MVANSAKSCNIIRESRKWFPLPRQLYKGTALRRCYHCHLSACPPLVFSSVHKESPAPDKDGEGGAANITYGRTISLEPEFSSHNQMAVRGLDQPAASRLTACPKINSASSYIKHVTVYKSRHQATSLVSRKIAPSLRYSYYTGFARSTTCLGPVGSYWSRLEFLNLQ